MLLTRKIPIFCSYFFCNFISAVKSYVVLLSSQLVICCAIVLFLVIFLLQLFSMATGFYRDVKKHQQRVFSMEQTANEKQLEIFGKNTHKLNYARKKPEK